MEATAQSVEDQLVDGLSFKLRPGASYITNRRSVTYYPHGGNQYSSTGVKVIKLMLTGSDAGSWNSQNGLRRLEHRLYRKQMPLPSIWTMGLLQTLTHLVRRASGRRYRPILFCTRDVPDLRTSHHPTKRRR